MGGTPSLPWAFWTRAEVNEDVVGDGDVAGNAADEAHAGVEADVAAHAGEGAAAHEAGAGHDEQALKGEEKSVSPPLEIGKWHDLVVKSRVTKCLSPSLGKASAASNLPA